MPCEYDENEIRENYRPSERVAIAEEVYRDEAEDEVEKRKAEGQKAGAKGLPATFRQADARDVIGKAVGWSGHTYERAREVVEAAKMEPDKYGELVEEMDRTDRVNGV